MSFFPDMAQQSYVAVGEHVRAVGWLHPDHPYPRGEVPADFVVRLKEFITRFGASGEAFYFPGSGGLHCCEFCGQAYGGGNLAVPSEDLLFIFPDLTVHYVEKHCYKPPAQFIAALLASPLPDTDEFELLTEPFWHMHKLAQERQGL